MNNYLLTNMDTIDKINYYLTKNKKTGADLCEFLGVSSGVYSQWNTRRTKPRNSKLPAIAEYLGASVSDLLPDEEPSAGIKKERPADGEALIRDLPEDIQQIIRICMNRPELASALLNLAKQIEKD